jgi:hypothetical protein
MKGFNLEIYSPSNRTLTVAQNMSPMPVQYISGVSGSNYRALSSYSYQIQTNGPAVDLIAALEIPYDPVKLLAFGVDPSNAFVGKLSADNQSWVIVESQNAVDMLVGLENTS